MDFKIFRAKEIVKQKNIGSAPLIRLGVSCVMAHPWGSVVPPMRISLPGSIMAVGMNMPALHFVESVVCQIAGEACLESDMYLPRRISLSA